MNPDEKVWNHEKNVFLRGRTPKNTDELAHEIRRAFHTMKNDPALLKSFLHASELPWDTAIS